MFNNAVDIVVPFYNEESVLGRLCEDFILQVGQQGHPLSKGTFRIIAVNNASTDSSVEVLNHYIESKKLPMVIINESEKGVVIARKTGSEFALKEIESIPYLLHIDADNRLPPKLISDVLHRFNHTGNDVLSYNGHFSTDFWLKVPELAQHYYEDVGILEFSNETLNAFKFQKQQALFNQQIFEDFIRVPNQLALAVRKKAFKSAGGYVREYMENGEEILGEARNLWFRLDRLGASLAYVCDPYITLNPRRLLCDPIRWCGGRSYEGGMVDLRQKGSNRDNQYDLLNKLAKTVDFTHIRRNLVKRFIIEPSITRPERIERNIKYFHGFYTEFDDLITNWYSHHEVNYYSDVLPLILTLCDRFSDKIIKNIIHIRKLK